MSFGIANIAPLLATFLAQNPGIAIDLHLSDARVDIVAEGFDIALRIGDLADSSLRARRICSIATYIVAAPAYLAAAGAPRTAADLTHHPLLRYANLPGPWRLHGPDGAEASIRPEGPLSANSGDALLPALLAGLGIATLPGSSSARIWRSARSSRSCPTGHRRRSASTSSRPPARCAHNASRR